ncbi:MAG: CpsD/CapB family tyrosine-protein kinase [Caldilineaceae bacterium]
MTDLITLTNPRSAAAEAYQSLRTSLEFSSLEKSLKTLLVTSADAHTDKSSAVANLAVVMAEAGDKVILVDGDLRRPQQHEIFGLHNQQGLSSWLPEGGPAPLQQTSVNRLQVLTAGPTHANPVALLSARRLGDALAELKGQADYVLCDAPPVLAVTDAALWAAKVDGVVLLVNAGGTKRDQALQARQTLERVHAHIVGAVLLNAERDAAMLGYEQ